MLGPGNDWFSSALFGFDGADVEVVDDDDDSRGGGCGIGSFPSTKSSSLLGKSELSPISGCPGVDDGSLLFESLPMVKKSSSSFLTHCYSFSSSFEKFELTRFSTITVRNQRFHHYPGVVNDVSVNAVQAAGKWGQCTRPLQSASL